MHYWSVENPHWLRQVQNQRTLNGRKYADILTNELSILLEDVPLQYRSGMWFHHDGCPAHNALVARNVLDRIFPDRWIGRGARIYWPARSPDLTLLDFFL
ncbi:hypothetical protein ANTPLA_LOCUS7964 [Anthophora plagiata]